MPPYRYYYLHNFLRALRWIGERSGDLLSPDEARFIAQFTELAQPSQALLVRLLMRRGPWFRSSRLVYEEIADIPAAATPLLDLGWLDAHQPLPVEALFALHTKPELARLFAELPLRPAERKCEWLEAVQAAHPQPQPYADWCPGAGEFVWQVTVAALCERLRLVFFGNLHQDWSEFVLADLGIFRYERVAFDAQSRAFQSRADVDRYLALHACRAALEQGAATPELMDAVAACASDNPWLEMRRAKTLLRIGQACERAGDWQQALQVYAQCHYPGARHRRMRMHERLGQFEAAHALATQAQAAPESEAESQRIARMLPRLSRHLGQPAPRRALPASIPTAQLVLPQPEPPCAVEWLVLAHLQQRDAPVHYVENTLIGALFGLLCWPAIFAPLPGAFFHPFQRGPADLDAPDFAQRRQALLAQCLAELDGGSYRATILQRFAGKHGVQSPFVHWGLLSEALLAQALDCIPADHLKVFFQRLLADVKGNRTGLPDLVQFWPAERRYALIEVKGPGDKLQDNQLRWMHYCLAHGIPVSVCQVRWGADAVSLADGGAPVQACHGLGAEA